MRVFFVLLAVVVDVVTATRATIASNARAVEVMNTEGGGAIFALNKFADVPTELFESRRLMRPTRPVSGNLARSSNSTNVTSWDWREKGAVTPVRDQGDLGTCWIFSALGNVESQRFIHQKVLEELSVEQVVECDSTQDDDDDRLESDCGEFGGWPSLAMEYIKKNGIRTDVDMPYCSSLPYGSAGNCLPCMPDGYSRRGCGKYDDLDDDDADDDLVPLYCEPNSTLGQGPAGLCQKAGQVKIAGWRHISADEAAIADALVESGPLSTTMNARRLQFYKKGVYDPKVCDANVVNHAVLIVGFGSEKNQDYWIVKNSWGADWGEEGYFRVARGKGVCGVNLNVVTSFL